MKTIHTNIETLEQVLRKQLETATLLTQILDEEAAAIKQRSADALTAVTAKKLTSIKHLEELEEIRQQQTSKGLRQSVSETQLWDQVLQVINLCHRKNQFNGVMLSLRQEQIKRAMDLIANRDAAATTYAPDGSTLSAAGNFSTSVSA